MALEFDLIFGLHSIASALKNSHREYFKLHATDEGLMELQRKYQINARSQKIPLEMHSSHQLQEVAKKMCAHKDVEFTRVPSGIFLETSPLRTYELKEFFHLESLKLIALDQITDVHNGAAITRTASFYGVTGILIPSEKSFGLTPSFYRIASGAVESVPLIRVSSMSRAATQLIEKGVLAVGLSEHSSDSLNSQELKDLKKICLFLGAEEVGLSNAVSRLMQKNLSLTSQGHIKSLNVSSAAAIAMEKCFGI